MALRVVPAEQVFEGCIGGLCRDDLVNMYIEALQSESFSGIYNATAPNPVRMSELCSSLGSQLGRPSWLPVPDFALQVLHMSSFSFRASLGPK